MLSSRAVVFFGGNCGLSADAEDVRVFIRLTVFAQISAERRFASPGMLSSRAGVFWGGNCGDGGNAEEVRIRIGLTVFAQISAEICGRENRKEGIVRSRGASGAPRKSPRARRTCRRARWKSKGAPLLSSSPWGTGGRSAAPEGRSGAAEWRLPLLTVSRNQSKM